MLINFWKCKYRVYIHEYDDHDEDVDFRETYGCRNPRGNKFCDLKNRDGGDKDDCKLLDVAKEKRRGS